MGPSRLPPWTDVARWAGVAFAALVLALSLGAMLRAALLAPPVAESQLLDARRLQGPSFVRPLDCRAPFPPDAYLMRIDAPPEGWPFYELSVLVLDAPRGRVWIRVGVEQRCGESGDARSTDARYRSGVGAMFDPGEGSTAPIEVVIAGRIDPGWPPSVRYGDPAQVQREDTLRFAVRVMGLSIVLAMLFSSILAFASVRDRVFALFALMLGAVLLWAAHRSGIAGWPRPWLPAGVTADAALVLLPLVMAGGLWPLVDRFCHFDRALPGAHRWRFAPIAPALLLGLAWLAWPEGRELAAKGMRWLIAGVALTSALQATWLLGRGERAPIPLLIALLPMVAIAAVHGGRGQGDAAAWASEAFLLAGAWFAVVMTVGLSLRIRGLRRQRDRMRELAERDPLTGLANRRAGEAMLRGAHAEALAQGRPMAVVFADLDRFKVINDAHGHDVGDEVLVEVAARLQSGLRQGDMVARHGGEEFVLLLPGSDADAALALAERMRAAIAASPVATGAGALAVTASFGVAVLDPARPVPTKDLLQRADQAMYRAKREGRDRVALA
jgi:diguanylate cyclase (GGDEF)-like protein